jgi:hypothetical protein
MLARFDEENPVQQWYGDASFSDFGFDYGAMANASSFHPPFDCPPPAHTHDDEGNEESREEEDDDEWSLLKTSPTLFSA